MLISYPQRVAGNRKGWGRKPNAIKFKDERDFDRTQIQQIQQICTDKICVNQFNQFNQCPIQQIRPAKLTTLGLYSSKLLLLRETPVRHK